MKAKFNLLLLSLFVIMFFSTSVKSFAEKRISENGAFIWETFDEHGRMGAKDMNGNILVPARFKSVDYYSNHTFLVTDLIGRKGLYSKTGIELIPCKYYQLYIYQNADSIIQVFNEKYRWQIFSLDGKELIGEDEGICSMSTFNYMNTVRIAYTVEDNTYGSMNEQLDNIIPTGKYNLIVPMNTKNADIYFVGIEFKDETIVTIMDHDGKEIAKTDSPFIQLQSDPNGIEYFFLPGDISNGRIELDGKITNEVKISKVFAGEVSVDGNKFSLYYNANRKFSLHDENGRELIPALYDNITPSNNGGLFLQKGRYVGMVNKYGKVIIEADRYRLISKIGNLFQCHKLDNTVELLDNTGKIVVSSGYGIPVSYVQTAQGAYSIIIPNGTTKCALFKCTENGKVEQVTSAIYKDFLNVNDNSNYLYPMDDLGNIGIIDYLGNTISYPKYTSVKYCSVGDYFSICDGDLAGILKPDKSVCIEPTEFTMIIYDSKKKTFSAINKNRKCVFSYDGKLISDSKPQIEFDNYVSMADKEFESGNYLKASDYYSKALSVKPTAIIYYNRGVCYYNNDNYNKAIEDFNRCLANNPSPSLRTDAYDLIDKSNYYKKQIRQKRLNNAFNILGTIFGVTCELLESRNQAYNIQQSTYFPTEPSYSNGYSPATTSTTSDSGKINCASCANSGKCSYCNGTGYGSSGGLGINTLDKSKKCSHCGGTGVCPICHGNHM